MRYLPIAAFLGLSLLWGSEWMLTASLSPQPRLRALAFEYGISAALLLPWAIHRRLWRKPLCIVVKAMIVGIGILCLPQILIAVGSRAPSPALSVAALATIPVLLAISGRLTITLAVCGLAGVLFLDEVGLDISIRQLPWLLLPLAAAGVLAWSLAGAEKHMKRISIMEALFGQCVISALLLFIASHVLEHEAVTWSATAVTGLAIDAVFTSLCGYLLFYWLLGKYGSGRVSMLQWTQPLVATAESAVLLHIWPDWTVIAGAVLIVIAIVWAFSNRDEVQGVMLEITQT